MRMKTITARDMQHALQQARVDIGEDAVILSSSKGPGGKGIVVTFAVEEVDPEIQQDNVQDEPRISAFFQQVRREVPAFAASVPVAAEHSELGEVLRFHRVPETMHQRCFDIAQGISGNTDDLNSELAEIVSQIYAFKPLTLRPGERIMLVGPTGAGKTLTIAKLAFELVSNKRQVFVITADTKRAGGVDQLAAFTRILGLNLAVASRPAELKTILDALGNDMIALIDTPGCNPYDFKEIKEIGEFARHDSIEPVLVLPAGGDAGEAEEMASVFSFLDIERMIVTRTDCARRFGSLLAAAKAGGYAFADYSGSTKPNGAIQPMDAAALAQLLLQYQREKR